MTRATWIVALLFGCSVVACGGESESNGGSGGGTQTGPLCDGSDSIRFLLTSGGGYVEPEYSFTSPYGSTYLVVTGKCEAYVAGDYMTGVRVATLSEVQAETFASDVRLSKIASWKDHEDQGCPDAGRNSISDGKSFAWCSCGCDPDAPAGLEAAQDGAFSWHTTLLAQGEPIGGPLAAAANADTSPAPNVTPVPWPLAWPVSSLPATNAGKAGKRVEGADADELRELRTEATLSGTYLDYIPVQSTGTERHRVYARDELPDALTAALDALLATK
ncbi:MAG: hypothetical protein HS104_02910 [Polyangiaceae bacterium]|nr:hypothetical protein [Polyangiaceae bacterium]MCE7891261.1 hypothetical protein [Sorangiineae bacterium PRO1]MCL4754881.1 hypothetical protein [Myxococcales bacterium]